MVLLDDEAQVEARFSAFGDSANLDARWVHCVCRTYHRLENHFGRTRSNFYVTWVMWIIVLICLETELASVQDSYTVQDRCTVCVKCTIR
jgi:Ni/Fe-hydrogenase subunit HybB-like protein